ncbi:DNA-3-methyladenine glycosylase I [Sandaracinomonas limnophila]|uniref:DNA-3-methyladenine glycosylase I n=1 Tax=Sandaracinomonas limnophila TaxID=1862386 RepID=A0A437PTD0_9BACT|nr:DNA-3-methyladenine glycosylase I [Sandaracinomonas limnophila]RVU25506.1 DNA-3-methyladenine glycosylase I [Sandaracinomonas limnophila]
MPRCQWVSNDPLYQNYHDTEWGVALHDERALFELLILEGFQAGLSWITILKKREDFRSTFENFDYKKIANWSDQQLEIALQNPKIVKNRLKVYSVRANAIAFLKIQEKFGSFDNYIWEFVNFQTIKNHFQSSKELPSKTELSVQISKSLKKNGFNFVGPTIVYSFMQAAGLVNDHTKNCDLY